MIRRVPLPLLVSVALLLATVLAYSNVGRLGFVNLDDDAYVEFAPMVNKGFRSAALVWAWTSVHTANWHPLTTLSHMLDCEWFGVRAAPMHQENLAWHALNTLLLFLIVRRLTNALWRPALVAALFALHPLHVESVAWISSRKDLLCTLFWFLGILAYLQWVRRPSAPRYALIGLCLAVALLFKPMAVTFPCTLLLLDAWPLARWSRASWRRLAWEKLPLFAIVVLHSAITFLVQHGAGAANYADRIPFGARVGNALVAYARYLGKTCWPDGLSPLYWHPGYWPLTAVAGATLILAAVTFLAWRERNRRPWFAFGWAWFVGTLVPVIGIVQVGAQSMADRYTYVPLIGVFIVVAWGAAEVAMRGRNYRTAVAVAAVAAVMACFAMTRRQVLTWEHSIRLYESSIAGGEDNPAIRYLLGTALARAGRPEAEVTAQFRRAVELQPDYVNAHTQLAMAAMRRNALDEARAILENNVRLEPRNFALHVNLGAFWAIRSNTDEAHKHLVTALRLAPLSPLVNRDIAQLYIRQQRIAEARTHFETAVRADPWNSSDLTQLGLLAANTGNLEAGRHYLERAVWIDPDNRLARRNLMVLDRLQRPKT